MNVHDTVFKMCVLGIQNHRECRVLVLGKGRSSIKAKTISMTDKFKYIVEVHSCVLLCQPRVTVT